MQIIDGAHAFSLSYPTWDQNTGLYVLATIYDVTTGSASLLGTVNLANDAFGVYSGIYTGASNKVYLAVILVYTDNTYSTVDTTRGPVGQCYNSQSSVTTLAFNYGAYDLASNLYIAGSVYDVSSGSPSLVTQVDMIHVLGGVYYGSYSGTLDKQYVVAIASYTSNTYMTLDTTRAPAGEVFQAFQTGTGTSITNVYSSAVITGQSLKATLVQT